MDFFRYPRTPHLAWLGPGEPREDKLLSPAEAHELLSHEVVVEEKVDGANVGLSVDGYGDLRAQNRGSYLLRGAVHPRFDRLFPWLEVRKAALVEALVPELILFGEWRYALHSVRYTRLPDWFVAFDVYDRVRHEFWSSVRRDDLVRHLGLMLVPRLARGRFDLQGLKRLIGPSRFGDGPAEGLYVRRDDGKHLIARAKLVRPEFVQAIDQHWSSRALQHNRILRDAAVSA